METYKRIIKFHDNNNEIVRSTLEITHRNGYPEFSMCNETLNGMGQSEFKSKDGNQTKLYQIWDQYHLNGTSAGLPIQVNAIVEWKKQGNEYNYEAICEHLKNIGLYELPLKANLPDGFFVIGASGKKEITDDETYKYGCGWVRCNLPEDFIDTLNKICDAIEEEEESRFRRC